MRPVLFLLALWLLVMACAPVCAAPEAGGAPRAAVYSIWNSSALYLAVKVPDRMIVGNQTGPLSQPWLDDAVAVYLDFDPTDGDVLNEKCVRVIISAAGGATVQRGADGGWQNDPIWFQLSNLGIIRYAVSLDGKLNDAAEPDHSYLVEMGLAWSLLRLQPPFVHGDPDQQPVVGFAVAVYAQGQTQSVSCWPSNLTEDDLQHPARWGQLLFNQTTQPRTVVEPEASATLTRGDIIVDGSLAGIEWLTGGVTTFPLRQGSMTAPESAKSSPVGVVAAWYLLDPPLHGARRPLEPVAAHAGPETAAYHYQQIAEVRRAGIDALAVHLPTDLPRERLRTHLSALVSALTAYDQANTAAYFTDTPLLLPVVEVRSGAERRAVEMALDDFYRLTPPQYRLMTANTAGQWCYPMALVVSGGPAEACPPLGELAAGLRAKLGRPVGWLLDSAWPETKTTQGVLARCAWDPLGGVQFGQGELRMALIAPGVEAGPSRHLPRRGGAVYDNGWLKLASLRPDLIIIRSWNDFADGTEIAPTRQLGTDYRDRTRLALIGRQQGRKFGVVLLQQSLPAVIPPGQARPVELLVKNAGVEKMVSREGFRVDYRLLRGDREVAHGTAVSQLALMELAAARLKFLLPTMKDKRPLPAGSYTLRLDFRRNKIAQIEIPGMTQTLGSLSLSVTLGPGTAETRLVGCELPSQALPGDPLPVSVRLRLPETLSRKQPLSLRLRWTADKGTALAAVCPLSLPEDAVPGALVTCTGQTPPAPGGPGWYQAVVELVRGTDPPVRLHAALVRVVEPDLRAQFLEIALPERIERAKDVEVPVTLRNAGKTDWPAKETAITWQWQRWDGQPVTSGSGAVPLEQALPAGRAVTLRLILPLPAGLGPVRCAFGVVSRGQPARLEANPVQRGSAARTAILRPARYAQVDLSSHFSIRTVVGLSARESAAQLDTPSPRGGLDGAGNAFPLEEFLPDGTRSFAGYPAGYGTDGPATLTAPFLFTPATQDRAPLVRARGQQIGLPDRAATALYLAAMSVDTDIACTVTVRYAEGPEQTVPLRVSPWLGAPRHGEPVVLRTRYLRTAHGDDWTRQGSVFAYRIPLDPKRQPVALVLPDQPTLCLFAATMVEEE